MDKINYLTAKEIATQMRVSPLTVRRLVQSGDLPGVVFGSLTRVKAEDFEKYLADNGKAGK